MSNAHSDTQPNDYGDRYRALLAVSEAIVLHRDLPALFHELAGRLHEVVQFDWLALILYDAPSQTMRMHVLEPCWEVIYEMDASIFPVEGTPAGQVWQTQKPVIIANFSEPNRWPEMM